MKKRLYGLPIKSLKGQLMFGVVLILTSTLLLAALLLSFWMRDSAYETVNKMLASRLHSVENLELIQTDTGDKLIQKASGFILAMMDSAVSVAVITPEGNEVLSSEGALRSQYLERLLIKDRRSLRANLDPPQLPIETYQKFILEQEQLEWVTTAKNDKGEPYQLLLSKVGPMGQFSGVIQLATPLAPVEADLQKQLQFILWIISAGGALGIGLVLIFLNVILKPLSDMTAKISAIDVTALDQTLPDYATQSELQHLSESFNALIRRLKSAFDAERESQSQLKNFVSDAAHELRTPLTSIRGFAEVLGMGDLNDAVKIRKGLNTIVSESERLTRLVNALLTLTKLDQGYVSEKERQSLTGLLKSLLPQLEWIAGRRTIETEFAGSCDVWMNQDQMKQIVLNLFYNACQYTSEDDGMIRIEAFSFRQNGVEKVQLTLSDNGIGIPPEACNEIFKRFYRVEAHRARKSGGDGLGLAIVKSLVDGHGGEIRVESQVGVGTKMIMVLPT